MHKRKYYLLSIQVLLLSLNYFRGSGHPPPLAEEPIYVGEKTSYAAGADAAISKLKVGSLLAICSSPGVVSRSWKPKHTDSKCYPHDGPLAVAPSCWHLSNVHVFVKSIVGQGVSRIV